MNDPTTWPEAAIAIVGIIAVVAVLVTAARNS